MTKQVTFDFPRDCDHVAGLLRHAKLRPTRLWAGSVVFRYDSAEAVLEHLLKSGAGTIFHDAIRPDARAELEQAFLARLRARHRGKTYRVAHDYIACIAESPRR